MPLCSWCWRPSRCPNFLQLGLLESLPIYLTAQVEFLNLASICPSKSEFSQNFFLCVQKGAERSFLRCFWPFWKLKACQNFLAICGHSYLSMKNREMLIFPQKEVPSKNVRQVAQCIRQKNLFFRPKISKLQKVSPISWNLGWVSFIKCCIGPRKP